MVSPLGFNTSPLLGGIFPTSTPSSAIDPSSIMAGIQKNYAALDSFSLSMGTGTPVIGGFSTGGGLGSADSTSSLGGLMSGLLGGLNLGGSSTSAPTTGSPKKTATESNPLADAGVSNKEMKTFAKKVKNAFLDMLQGDDKKDAKSTKKAKADKNDKNTKADKNAKAKDNKAADNDHKPAAQGTQKNSKTDKSTKTDKNTKAKSEKTDKNQKASKPTAAQGQTAPAPAPATNPFTGSFGFEVDPLAIGTVGGGDLGNVVNGILFGPQSYTEQVMDSLSGGSSLAERISGTTGNTQGKSPVTGAKLPDNSLVPSLLSTPFGDADLFGGSTSVIKNIFNGLENPANKKSNAFLNELAGTDFPPAKKKKA